MIGAEAFIMRARAHGFSLYTGVPCSYLKPFINFVIDDPDLCYVSAANEGDAVAVAAGAELAGRRSVVMFQNSGFGNAVNPLTSLTHTFRIPVLIIVTWRGEPGGAADEPQHEMMGRITPDLLDLLDIPWAFFPDAEADIEPTLAQAVGSMAAKNGPFALIMRKGSVAPCALRTVPTVVPPGPPYAGAAAVATACRTDVLRAIQHSTEADDIVVATTGYTGRELWALDDRPNQLYMVGSMGCAMSFGLGIALARPDRRVIVLDGDGALLMRLGALAMLGEQRPPNLVHVVLDNRVHESTGGQRTLSAGVDFCAVAAACGYPTVRAAATPDELAACLETSGSGPLFIHVPTVPGVPDGLPRPTVSPAEVAARLRAHIGSEGPGA